MGCHSGGVIACARRQMIVRGSPNHAMPNHGLVAVLHHFTLCSPSRRQNREYIGKGPRLWRRCCSAVAFIIGRQMVSVAICLPVKRSSDLSSNTTGKTAAGGSKLQRSGEGALHATGGRVINCEGGHDGSFHGGAMIAVHDSSSAHKGLEVVGLYVRDGRILLLLLLLSLSARIVPANVPWCKRPNTRV